MADILNSNVSFRANADSVEKFNQRCDDMDRTPSGLFREFMTALCEGRVMIKRSEKQKHTGDMYVD